MHEILSSITPKEIIEYGFAGVGLLMMFYLNITWQRAYIEFGNKISKNLETLQQAISLCQGIHKSHGGTNDRKSGEYIQSANNRN